jgi:hypothetical protein
MTGFDSKRQVAKAKMNDEADTLTIVYQQGFADGKRAAQPEQEPVAYYHPHKGFYWAKPTHISSPTVVDVPPVPLYGKWIAAQRPWVGLEIEEVQDSYNSDYQTQTRAVEKLLKERNNG